MPMNWAKANHGLRKFASAVRAVFCIDSLSPGRVAVGDVVRRGGFVPPVLTNSAGLSSGFCSGRGAVAQPARTPHGVLGQPRAATEKPHALHPLPTATRP